jgi:hypothetical protein
MNHPLIDCNVGAKECSCEAVPGTSEAQERDSVMMNRLWHWVGVLSVSVSAVFAGKTDAASINYGNFGPVAPGVSFLGVTESSGTDNVPMYGPPTPFVTGIDFDPIGFVSSSAGGSADVTDGQLNYTVSGSGVAIGTISLFERGDYTLAGSGTLATFASAGAVIFATVTEVDGAPVAPIVLPPVNASVSFNLPANAGVAQPWSLGLGLNVAAALASSNTPFVLGATKVEIAIDNTLATGSQPGTVAFIAKKDFRIDIDPIIPEPAVGGVLLLTLLGARRRRNTAA